MSFQEKDYTVCQACSGMGWRKKRCPTCDGAQKVAGHWCPTCQGVGYLKERCPSCHGQGVVPRW